MGRVDGRFVPVAATPMAPEGWSGAIEVSAIRSGHGADDDATLEVTGGNGAATGCHEP
jgi:hypothetical protein